MPLSHKSARRSEADQDEDQLEATEDGTSNTKASKRPKKPSLLLTCEWGPCAEGGREVFDDMPAFIDHVTYHLRDLAPDIMTLEQASEPRQCQCYITVLV